MTQTTYRIETEMLGAEATDRDRDRMVDLLRDRGYDVEAGAAIGNEQDAIPESVWNECLEQLG